MSYAVAGAEVQCSTWQSMHADTSHGHSTACQDCMPASTALTIALKGGAFLTPVYDITLKGIAFLTQV